MSQTSRIVIVRQGGDVFEQRDCRRVRLPGGREGVVWRGLAYAVAPDGSIEAFGDPVSPSDCTPINERRLELAVIPGADEAYVVLAGDGRDCERVAASLRSAGITVLRMGRYFGEPVGALVADWFVRVACPADPAALDAFVARWSEASPPAPQPAAVRIPLLEAEVAAARAREASLELALAALRQREDAHAADLDQLGRRLAEEQARREAAEAAARERATVPPPPRAEPPARAPKLAAEIATVFASLLGRIDLLRDSAAVIAAEYGDRGAVYRALAFVERGEDMAKEWKKLRGAAGWWERHIPTGESDAGRLYACLGGDRRWKVLISHKGQQGRDIDWLQGAGRL